MINKFYNFIKENSQSVVLDNGRGGNLIKNNKYSDKSIANLNSVIKRFVESVYGPYGFIYGKNDDIIVKDKIINGEYISKMVNNYTVFKAVIRVNNLRDEDSFYNFMMNNLNDIYGPNGKFFLDQTMPILINTTRKGNIGEIKCKEEFNSYAKSKNKSISIQNPTIEEDIRGVDFIFISNGKKYTVQVKPFTKYKSNDEKIWVKSQGSLSVDTDYLMLFNDSSYIILRNPVNDRISIQGDVFITSSSNIVKII